MLKKRNINSNTSIAVQGLKKRSSVNVRILILLCSYKERYQREDLNNLPLVSSVTVLYSMLGSQEGLLSLISNRVKVKVAVAILEESETRYR